MAGLAAAETFTGDGAGPNSGVLDLPSSVTGDAAHVVCTCDEGYEPDATGLACQNIDPCTDGSNYCSNGVCEDHAPPAVDYQCNCDDGYENTDGKYDCEPVPCDPVGIPNSNTPNGVTMDTGGTHAVTCSPGYGEVPVFDITCEGVAYARSEWQDILPCDPLDCEPLYIPNSKEHSPSAATFETHDTTTVTCADGYRSEIGCEFQVDCRATTPGFVAWGTMGADLGVPSCDAVTCPDASIDNSDFEADGEVTGDSATVTCNSGYHVAGYFAFNVECVGASACTSVWEGFEDCVPVLCSELAVENSEYASTYNTGMDTESAPLAVTCANGYQPAGGDNDACTVERSCSPNGPGHAMWTGDESCVRKQCDAFTVVDGDGGSSTETIDGAGKQTVQFTCRDGFSPNVSGGAAFTATCDVVSPCEVEWNGVEDCECVPCTGLYIADSDSGSDSCAEQSTTVTCDDGFCADDDGMFEVSCTGVAPGQASWTGQQTCEPVACPAITIANSNFRNDGFVNGDAVTVECAAGYRVPGTAHDAIFEIQCIPDGLCASQWTGLVVCEPVPCDSVTIANSESGTYTPGSTSVSAPDYFTCASGFQPSQEAGNCQVTRQCVPQSPGYSMWSGTTTCDRVVCSTPSGEHYGTWSESVVDGVQIGTQTCANGYGTPDASFTTACVPAGVCARQWDNLDTCDCLDCPAVLFQNSNFVEDPANACTENTQTVDCLDGYCPSDSGFDTFTITCSPVAPGVVEWTGEQTCEPVSCGVISFVNSDQNAERTGVTGDQFEVNCGDGYSAGDCTAFNVECVATGHCSSAWTNSDFECREEGYVPPADEPESTCAPPNTHWYLLEDPTEFEAGTAVSVPITLTCEGGVITNEFNPITEICLNIEHSYVDDLRIELICPNGLRRALLMAGRASTSGAYFGDACDDTTAACTPGTHGTGWEYCFKDDIEEQSNLFTMYDAPTSCSGSCTGRAGSCCVPAKYQIPSGNYQTQEHFTKFEGCQLAGEWTLEITDTRTVDDGWLYSVVIGLADTTSP